MDLHLAALLLAGYVALKLIDQIIMTAWKKSSFATQYVTVEECQRCRDLCKGITGDTMTELRTEVKQLKNIIIRHMLMNTIPEDTAARKELEKMIDA